MARSQVGVIASVVHAPPGELVGIPLVGGNITFKLSGVTQTTASEPSVPMLTRVKDDWVPAQSLALLLIHQNDTFNAHEAGPLVSDSYVSGTTMNLLDITIADSYDQDEPGSLVSDSLISTTISTPALPGAIMSLSPAGYWKFDDATTTAVDSSGNGRNGTHTGTTLKGQVGPDTGAYAVFDADADKIEIADAAQWSIDNSGVGLTIGFLIRYTSTALANIVYKGIFPSCEWNVASSGGTLNSVTLTASNSTIRSGNAAGAGFTTGVWYAVLLVWPHATNPSQVEMYVNGVSLSVGHGGAGGIYTNGGSPLGWGVNANDPTNTGKSFRGALAHGFVLPYAADTTARATYFAAADGDGWY